MLLNPLAYPHSDRLVVIYARIARLDSAPIEYPNFLDWQRDSRSFALLAAYRNEDFNFIGNGEGERLRGYMISASFFDTLKIAPVLGCRFRLDDDQIGAAPVVVLSGGFWKRKFGSSPEISWQAVLRHQRHLVAASLRTISGILHHLPLNEPVSNSPIGK